MPARQWKDAKADFKFRPQLIRAFEALQEQSSAMDVDGTNVDTTIAVLLVDMQSRQVVNLKTGVGLETSRELIVADLEKNVRKVLEATKSLCDQGVAVRPLWQVAPIGPLTT